MTPQYPQAAQPVKQISASTMLPPLLAAVILIVTAVPASLAAAGECQINGPVYGGSFQGTPTWKGTALNIPPLTITVPRELYGELLSSPTLEFAPTMKNNRFTRGNTESRGMDSIDTCWSQYIRKSAPVHQAMIKSFGKSPVKAFTQIMRLPAFAYNGKRPIIKTGLTLPEIVISAPDTAVTLIGPVQENRKPSLSDGSSLSLFEDRLLVASDPYQNGLRPPPNESLRMDLTTNRTLHGGNCPNGCP